MPKLNLTICCPQCNHTVQASVKDNYRNFLIFVCPNCHRNVAYYDNKVDIISDRLVKKLMSKKHLQYCGVLENNVAVMEHGSGKGLTRDSIMDLRILLETSQDVNDFISKI